MNRISKINAWAARTAQALAVVACFAFASCCDDDSTEPTYNRPPGYNETITTAGQFSITVDPNDNTHTDGSIVGTNAYIYLLDENGNTVAENLKPGVTYNVQVGTYTVLAVDIRAEEGTAPYTIENGVIRLGTYTRGDDHVNAAPNIFAGSEKVTITIDDVVKVSPSMEPYTRPINVNVELVGASAADIAKCEVTLNNVRISADLCLPYGNDGLSDVARLFLPMALQGEGSSVSYANLVRLLGILMPASGGGIEMGITITFHNGKQVAITQDVTELVRRLIEATEANPLNINVRIDLRQDGSVNATITGWGEGWDEEIGNRE